MAPIPTPLEAQRKSRSDTNPDQIWNQFIRTHKIGQAITGEVCRIYYYGAFVEFPPGVQGLVHRSQILPNEIADVEAVLWPGDQVRAVIQNIDYSKRQIVLSISEFLRRVHGAVHPVQPTAQPVDASQSQPASNPDASSIALLPDQYKMETENLMKALRGQAGVLKNILIVEDQHDLSDSLANLLREAGFCVESLHDASRVVETVIRDAPDLLLMDAHIPGRDSTDLAIDLLNEISDLRIILMSGYTLSPEEEAKLASLPTVYILMKPFTVQELDRLLATAEQSANSAWRQAQMNLETKDNDAIEQDILAARNRSDLALAAQRLLSSLVEETEVTAGAVFSMGLFTRRVEILAQVGIDLEVFERERQDLDLSPIKDVIIGREHIVSRDVVQTMRAKFRYLLRLLDFRACLGQPIGTAGDLGYGLFLFHSDSDIFDPRRCQHANFTASALQALVERYAIQESLISSHSFGMMGQISAGLAHEVNNRINALINQAGLIQRYSQALARSARASESPTTVLPLLQKEVEALTGTTDRLYHVAQLFQRLISPQQGSVCNLAVTLPRVVELLSVTARKNKVDLILEPIPSATQMISANDIALEQVLINLALNSIQQISERHQADGLVLIRSEIPEDQAKYGVRILIADNGPGIHRQLWEQVFELGFSTRQGGSGIGLFVARSIVESFGGQIAIQESPLLAGTTFAISLQVSR